MSVSGLQARQRVDANDVGEQIDRLPEAHVRRIRVGGSRRNSDDACVQIEKKGYPFNYLRELMHLSPSKGPKWRNRDDMYVI